MADRAIESIWEKVKSGTPLDVEDGLDLYRWPNLAEVGLLAERACAVRPACKRRVYFNINLHINPTNVCENRCALCAFSRDGHDPEAYTMSVEEVVERARGAPADATEVHIVGGLNPVTDLEYYEAAFSRIREARPELHIQALTMVEFDYLARSAGVSVEEVLSRLKAAGLGSIPGGGAEIFEPAVRAKICGKKISGKRWLEIARTAHVLGLKSNATMLYGHVETFQERLEHMVMLRELQEETSGFQSFIPLPFLPENTALEGTEGVEGPSGPDILRTYAVSRLMLHNFDHIKAFWIMVGVKLAQVSLYYGVNDLDGTVVEERIAHAAGASGGSELSVEEIVRLIKSAGRVPVQRDTLYNVVRAYGADS